MNIKIKDLPKDKIISVGEANGSTIINIPHGRIRLMPKDKKHKAGYSARRGGRATPYKPGTRHKNYGVPISLTNKGGQTVILQASERGLSHKESMTLLYRKMYGGGEIRRKK